MLLKNCAWKYHLTTFHKMFRHRLYRVVDRIKSIDQLCIAWLFCRSPVEIDGIRYELERLTSQRMLYLLGNVICMVLR